jgi:ketosteroid isomerase-like protein
MPNDEHPNVSLIRSMFDAYHGPDGFGRAELENGFAEDAVFYVIGEHPRGGRYEGIDGAAQIVGNLVGDSSGTWRPLAMDLRAIGDEIVVLHVREGAEVAGVHHEGDVVVVVRFVDGKIVEGARFTDSELAEHWAKALA